MGKGWSFQRMQSSKENVIIAEERDSGLQYMEGIELIKSFEHEKEQFIHDLIRFKKMVRDDADYYSRCIDQTIINVDKANTFEEMTKVMIDDLLTMMRERNERWEKQFGKIGKN